MQIKNVHENTGEKHVDEKCTFEKKDKVVVPILCGRMLEMWQIRIV